MSSKYKTYSDRELVFLLRHDQKEAEKAFSELYNRYSSQVHAYCYRVINNPDVAEDIFQETFIRFYQNVKDNHKELNVPGFLITIARNLCLNYKRDRKIGVPVEEARNLFYQDNYESKELLDLITRALDLLEDEYREVFILKEYAGMQYSEIAEILNISPANAKTRAFRAKQKIKEILSPYLKDLTRN
ncbi:MAG: RNA polymerase sigma factor [Bacteroidota bacterium]